MFYRINSATPKSDFELLISFKNGIRKKYDVKPLFSKWPEFKTFYTVLGLFEQVKVEPGGYGVSWNDNLDLSCNELYQNGTPLEGDSSSP
ncbi:MAG: DUF2442 domain-containing protein [Holosporales bacterium]|jgi:hypothetical protein|nr:DUF2442 domain-containing protein [Holosporales bacterium]